MAYEDDASRFVTGYGMFDTATTNNALEVLGKASINNDGPWIPVLRQRGRVLEVRQE